MLLHTLMLSARDAAMPAMPLVHYLFIDIFLMPIYYARRHYAAYLLTPRC